MFYLKHFFSHILKQPLGGMSFLLFGLAFVVLCSHRHTVYRSWQTLAQEREKRPYFYALISSSKNRNDLKRKLTAVPGVEQIEILDSNKIKREAGLLLSDYGPDFDQALVDLNYFGLKVLFDRKVQQRAQKLIVKYLVRLVGKDHIIPGGIRNRPREIRPLADFIKNKGGMVALGVLFCLWFFLGLRVARLIKKTAYLMERFQRRSFIAVKIWSVGLGFLFLVGTGLACFYGAIDKVGWVLAFILTVGTGLAMSGSYQWSD